MQILPYSSFASRSAITSRACRLKTTGKVTPRATAYWASVFVACGGAPKASQPNFKSEARRAKARESRSPRPCRLVLHSSIGQDCSGVMQGSSGLMSDLQNAPIRILIVDDHPVVLAGLTSMLGTQAGMEIAGFASGGEEALQMLQRTPADLLLLDLRMPGMSGIDTLHALKRAKISIRVVILTSFETDEDIYRAVQAGAQGYLLKDAPQADMIDAIRAVHSGKRYFPRHIAARLAERMMRTNLTARELEVLNMLARGLTNKQIGHALEISDNTVRNHVNSIIEKLEVSDRTEAATTAIHRGIIDVNN